MFTEVLLILPVYVNLLVIWLRFRHVAMMMVNVETILNNEEIFGHTVDTPKEGVGQYRN